jgi:hypothetical protein
LLEIKNISKSTIHFGPSVGKDNLFLKPGKKHTTKTYTNEDLKIFSSVKELLRFRTDNFESVSDIQRHVPVEYVAPKNPDPVPEPDQKEPESEPEEGEDDSSNQPEE